MVFIIMVWNVIGSEVYVWNLTSNSYVYSYKCGNDYHAPTDCETIKRWLTKCADDSETANYISAHTKDVSVLPL